MLANPTLGLRLSLRLRHIPVSPGLSSTGGLCRAPCSRRFASTSGPKTFSCWRRSRSRTSCRRESIGAVVAAFFCFSFMASASYLVNDLLDIDSDRRHPAKRFRPFAAGDLPVSGGVGPGLALIRRLGGDSALASPSICALAGGLHRRHHGLLLLSQAGSAGGRADALRPLHPAPAGRRRGHRNRDLPLAGRFLHLPVSLPRHGQALQRTGKPARARRQQRPMDAAIWSPTSSRFAASAPPAPRPPWWFSRSISRAPT